MKKLYLLKFLAVTSWFNCSYGQSRGIMYSYSGVNNTATSNDNVFASYYDYDPYLNPNNYHSTLFEIANENVIVHTPFVKLGNNYFSLLSKYDINLCPIETKKIPIPPPINSAPLNPLENVAYNGTSKNDGGFALITNTYPHILRNYDNQGNFIFSKIITCPPLLGNFWPYNSFYESRAKIVANPYNNNLYVLIAINDITISGMAWNNAASPCIFVLEISPSGNLVNSFKLAITLAPAFGGPFIIGYSDPMVSPNPLLHDFTILNQDFIGDVKYVKGGNGPSGDRLWVALNMEYRGSFEFDMTSQTVLTPNYVQSSFFSGNQNLLGIALFNPQGTTSDVSVMLPSTYNGILPSSQLVITKEASQTLPAEMMVITKDNNLPTIYKFSNHYSTVPSGKFIFPISFFNGTTDLKYYDKNILFSYNSYFGIFNPKTLNISLRQANPNNSQTLGYVDFFNQDTRKLYINYNNYNFYSGALNPENTLISESIFDFNTTCWSKFFGNYTAVNSVASRYPLYTQLFPLSGFVLTNDLSYTETPQFDTVQFKNICSNCINYNRSSGHDIETPDNLNIILHPNPTKNYFELTTELTVGKVEVYSLLGQSVKTFEKQDRYMISDLIKGTYIVKIETTEGVSNKTLIVE